MLEDNDKAVLLKLARETLEAYFVNGKMPPCQTPGAALLEPKGAFVSLHRGTELRGCIGQLMPDYELYRVVQHCVLSAALEDTRFISVTQNELKNLTIEISVLTPFNHIQSIEEIEVGRHGLYMVRGIHRGLLLPQVATQYNWDRKTFLEQTCLKSGLPESAWKDPRTTIHTFEAEVFSEPQIPAGPK
ncbi:MAG: AmmeMemoRadiSam system protein A [Acidobacteria bacterium]|nr:AmmeMemoRadiSam system protein A [Acidobacteriota bacterium]